MMALVFDEIDHAFEIGLGADRKLDRDRLGLEAVDDHRQRALERSAGAVHFVDEAEAGNAVLVSLTPNGLGLRFNTGDGVEHHHPTVEHAQRALHFDSEVDVARRVDDVDAVVLPRSSRRGRGDGDAALALLDHPVHRRGAFMHFARSVDPTGVEEDALGGRRFARIDVGNDADVARLRERR